jgi:predicted phosphodiesterase
MIDCGPREGSLKTSGLFTLHRYRIPVPRLGEAFKLIFFGDIHRDSPNHAHDKWKEFLDYARRQKDAWFFGMGDYIDSMSTSEREQMIRASMHETTTCDLENMALGKVATLAKELAFMRGRLIGLVNGNHYFTFPSGINSDQKLCEKLDCKYLGVSTFTRLSLDFHGAFQTFDIWAHHGAGGARLPGGSINRVDQMREHAEADCYVMGHDHKRGVFPANPRMLLAQSRGGLRLRERQQWLIRSGSFLKSYDDGQVSYNVDAGRGPCSIGHVELEITLTKTQKGGGCDRGLQVRGIA